MKINQTWYNTAYRRAKASGFYGAANVCVCVVLINHEERGHVPRKVASICIKNGENL